MFYFRYLPSIIAIFCGVFILSLQQSIIAKQADAPVFTPAATTNDVSTVNSPSKQQPLFCPQPEELIKKGLNWSTKNGKWKSFTPSSATKILSFSGAQWVGIKVGDIICLYKTDEAVSFPVELEQTNIQSIIEPKNVGWSALIGNRKVCKSANVADCQYFMEPPKDISNIYKEIEYAPKK